MNPLEDWAMNVLFNWKAGEYITYNPGSRADVVSNVQVKDYFNFSLRVNKTIPIARMKCTFYVEVENLINTRRLSGAGFYDNNDYLFYMQSLHLPESKDYDNIPGGDRVGEFRKDGVEYQPVFRQGQIVTRTEAAASAGIPSGPGEVGVIYWDASNRRYMEWTQEAQDWEKVPDQRMNRILKDKAYIDMPNQTYFNFLYPRQVFFGITVSF
jgi:hypothetical protein